MAFRVIRNSNSSIVLHAVANSSVVVAGNNSVSNITSSDSDIIVGATVTQIQCGSPSGSNAFWQVIRGANVVAVVDSTAYLDFRAGMPITLDPSANLTVNLNNAADGQGYIMVELKKQY